MATRVFCDFPDCRAPASHRAVLMPIHHDGRQRGPVQQLADLCDDHVVRVVIDDSEKKEGTDDGD